MRTLTDLIEAGWPVVPLRPGAKAPRSQSWMTQTFTAADFRPDDNVGVKTGVPSPVGTLLDVDCDTDAAVRLAARLLPSTLTHGRPSAPTSHYWYVCESTSAPSNRVAWTDLDGSVIIELRGSDHQTLVPPSIHPSGEPLSWDSDRDPLVMSWDALESAVRLVALACLLSAHYPESGGRHEAFAHLGGVLARLKMEPMTATALVNAVTAEANDPEGQDRLRVVLDTLRRHQDGTPTTGAPHFEQAWPEGKSLLARVYHWFHYAGNDLVERMNEKHFVVPGAQSMMVATVEPGQPLLLQTFKAFKERYLNVGIRVPTARGDKLVSAGQVWLESPARREYRRITFAPPPRVAASDEYNLWQGFAVEPDPDHEAALAQTARFREHLFAKVSGGSDERYAWLMDFFADMIQHPGRPSGKCLALRGRSGSGKSLTIEAIGALLGEHYIAISSRDQLVGRFNGHLSGKVMVFADEAMWGGDKQNAGVYKRLVTQNTLTVERKFADVTNEPNCLRVCIASNENWVVPATVGERRAVVLQMDDVPPQSYFDALWAEIQAPNFSRALLTVLQQWTIDEGRLRKGFMSAALADQIDQSVDLVTQWWAQCLMDGRCTHAEDRPWPEWVAQEELYQKFTEDMGRGGAGHGYRGTRKAFISRLLEYLNRPRVEPRLVTMLFNNAAVQSRRLCVALPNLEVARLMFDEHVGFQHAWIPLDERPESEEPF